MKAVIVECSNGAAVALCDDGTFRKLKNKGYSIGQELLIQRKKTSNRMVQKLSICASLALVLLSFAGIGSHSYVEPYSYVSLDINPSIEYALNRYDKVISVSGVNTEGQQVVSSIEADIKNQNITTALGVTIGQLEKDRYIIQERYNHVIVSVYSTNDTKAQSIASRVNSFSAEKSDICSIDTIPVSKEIKDDADSLGITPGKLALIHAVAETTSDSDFDVSEWTDKTVSELDTTIQQASNQTSSESNPAPANAVNSGHLSGALDDNDHAANKPDSSTMDTNPGAGSASADKQTPATDDTSADSGTNSSVSASKPGHSGNTITPAANGSADSAEKPGTSGTGSQPSAEDGNGAANQDHTTDASDKNTSSSKGDSGQTGTSPSKDPASADGTSSPAKGDSSDSGNKQDANDALTEDSSSKKDSYPLPDIDTSEGTSGEDTMQEDTASKNLPYKDPSDPTALNNGSPNQEASNLGSPSKDSNHRGSNSEASGYGDSNNDTSD